MLHTPEIKRMTGTLRGRTSRRAGVSRTPGTGESPLTAQLRELACSAWHVGHQALLYCADCEAAIPYKYAVDGPKQNWPYCPFHRDKPLMIHSAALAPPGIK